MKWVVPEYVKSQPDETWDCKPCRNPQHEFPSMLYIPPGQIYKHVCPACGRVITVRGQEIYC